MRRAVAALVVTAVAVVLLAGYSTEPPRTFNPNSALRETAPPRFAAPAVELMRSPDVDVPPDTARTRTGEGPLVTTPFSALQVRATLTDGRLVRVETVVLAGDGPYTDALNARAEPILREEALRAGSADVDVVSGATYTSRSWLESLQAAIDHARG